MVTSVSTTPRTGGSSLELESLDLAKSPATESVPMRDHDVLKGYEELRKTWRLDTWPPHTVNNQWAALQKEADELLESCIHPTSVAQVGVLRKTLSRKKSLMHVNTQAPVQSHNLSSDSTPHPQVDRESLEKHSLEKHSLEKLNRNSRPGHDSAPTGQDSSSVVSPSTPAPAPAETPKVGPSSMPRTSTMKSTLSFQSNKSISNSLTPGGAFLAMKAANRFKKNFSYRTNKSDGDQRWPEIIHEECPLLRFMMILSGVWDKEQFVDGCLGSLLYRFHAWSMSLVMVCIPGFHLLEVIFAEPLSEIREMDIVQIRFQYTLYLILTTVAYQGSKFVQKQYDMDGSLGEFIEDLSSVSGKFHIPWHKLKTSCFLCFLMSGFLGSVLIYMNITSLIKTLENRHDRDDLWFQTAVWIKLLYTTFYSLFAYLYILRSFFTFVSFGFMGHLHAMDVMRFGHRAREALQGSGYTPFIPTPVSPNRIRKPSRQESCGVMDRLGVEGACVTARLKETNETWGNLILLVLVTFLMVPLVLTVYLCKNIHEDTENAFKFVIFDGPLLLCLLYALYWMMSGLAVVADTADDVCRYTLNHPRFLKLSADHMGEPFAIIEYVKRLELSLRVSRLPLDSVVCFNVMVALVSIILIVIAQLFYGLELG